MSKLRLVATEAASAVAGASSDKGTEFNIVIISPGQGSSGFYPVETIKRDGPKVFHEGIQVFFDHPGESEMWDRPERSVKDLVGKLSADATWNESDQRLDGKMLVMPSKVDAVKELAEVAGMSIAAHALGEWSEEGGQPVFIITELVEARSVDIVTQAGRGGAILEVAENARKKGFSAADQLLLHEIREATDNGSLPHSIPTSAVAETKTGVKMTEMDKETAEKLTASNTALAAAITAQLEAAAATEADRKAREAKEAEVDPLDVALGVTESLSTSDLPPAAQKRVIEAIRSGAVTDVAKAIETEKAYLADVLKAQEAAAPQQLSGLAAVTGYRPVAGTRASEAANTSGATGTTVTRESRRELVQKGRAV